MKIFEKSEEKKFKKYYETTILILGLGRNFLENGDYYNFVDILDDLERIYMKSEKFRHSKEKYKNSINYIFKFHIQEYEKLDYLNKFQNKLNDIKNIIN
jgi:hypothetical protein